MSVAGDADFLKALHFSPRFWVGEVLLVVGVVKGRLEDAQDTICRRLPGTRVLADFQIDMHALLSTLALRGCHETCFPLLDTCPLRYT